MHDFLASMWRAIWIQAQTQHTHLMASRKKGICSQEEEANSKKNASNGFEILSVENWDMVPYSTAYCLLFVFIYRGRFAVCSNFLWKKQNRQKHELCRKPSEQVKIKAINFSLLVTVYWNPILCWSRSFSYVASFEKTRPRKSGVGTEKG